MEIFLELLYEYACRVIRVYIRPVLVRYQSDLMTAPFVFVHTTAGKDSWKKP